jgi:N-acetyl-anhydromuramyl-L-alanine amidase AmpD
MSWNPMVPAERRIATTKKNEGRPVPKPTHVVCHVTGDNDFEKVRDAFLNQARSAHYVVDKQGLIYQFVEEEDQAWHAGIVSAVQALYATPASNWRKYLYFFDWYKGYPGDAVYLDGDLNTLAGKAGAVFVRRSDGSEWPHYDYFKTRWGANAGPVNYATSKRPNAYAVGIEILSVGATTASANDYTEAMYAALRSLVQDICGRHGIPMAKGTVLGHEDVNPVQRFGWDPNQGFNWSRVWA